MMRRRSRVILVRQQFRKEAFMGKENAIYKKLETLAAEAGFSHYGPLKTEALVVRREARDMCAANRCGMYGTSWVCPPGCGELSELSEKLSRMTGGILLQSTGEMEDDFDFESIAETEKLQKERFAAFMEKLADVRGAKTATVRAGQEDAENAETEGFRAARKNGEENKWITFLPLSSGGCHICKKCTYPDAPCRFPEKAFPSMEACGLVVNDVCKASGVPYNYGPRTMTFTGCVLY